MQLLTSPHEKKFYLIELCENLQSIKLDAFLVNKHE